MLLLFPTTPLRPEWGGVEHTYAVGLPTHRQYLARSRAVQTAVLCALNKRVSKQNNEIKKFLKFNNNGNSSRKTRWVAVIPIAFCPSSHSYFFIFSPCIIYIKPPVLRVFYALRHRIFFRNLTNFNTEIGTIVSSTLINL